MNYKLEDFDYNLPLELIAQEPSKPRDHSRLLLLNKEKASIEHKHFYDLVDYLKAGDLLILNNSKVFPARLIGQRLTGGRIEVLLDHQVESPLQNNKKKINVWECLIRGSVKLGQIIKFKNNLEGEIVKINHDGTRQIAFNCQQKDFWKIINEIGQVPLPPYIKRPQLQADDRFNYQTIYANKHKIGSAAAPTAGLHFTPQLLKKIKTRGVKIEYVTLHVGLGTFAPVKTEFIKDHHMHQELVEISVRTQKAVIKAKKEKRRVIAVGTTSCRTLESGDWSGIKSNLPLRKQSFWTDIFIYPGYQWKIVDALITNFHLPKSTLLMLVSALAGKELIAKAYQKAIAQRYRFFSYGDAMFIY